MSDGREPSGSQDDEPDPRLVWQWAARAIRPWLGWIFVGAGALLILVGYLGVSREAIVGKQMPYLVSGGIGGVMLTVVGAYFLGTEELRKDSGRLDRLEHMVTQLHAALLERSDAPDVTRIATPSGNGASVASTVVIVDDGEMFHREGCAMVAGKTTSTLAANDATAQGLRPCPVCEPAAGVATTRRA